MKSHIIQDSSHSLKLTINAIPKGKWYSNHPPSRANILFSGRVNPDNLWLDNHHSSSNNSSQPWLADIHHPKNKSSNPSIIPPSTSTSKKGFTQSSTLKCPSIAAKSWPENQGTVGCTPIPTYPLWKISILALYSGYLWVKKSPRIPRGHDKYQGSLLGVNPIVTW